MFRPDHDLTVMSFNLRASIRDVQHHWLRRRSAVRSILQEHAAGLIGLQEAFRLRCFDLSRMLPQHECHLGCPGGSRVLHSYNPVFWSSKAVRVLKSGGFWLGATPERWSRDAAARFVRTVTWSLLEYHGKSVMFLNVHLDAASEDARLRSIRSMLEHVADSRRRGIPVIIVGDFNAQPDSPEYVTMLRAGFRDSYLDAARDHSDPGYTFHGFAERQAQPARIDYAFYTEPLEARSVRLVRDTEASDHFALITSLRYRDGGGAARGSP